MNKGCLLITLIGLFTLLSCEKNKDEDVDCSQIELDFVYSIGYDDNMYYATVCYANASNDLPAGTQLDWTVNGSIFQDDTYGENCYRYVDNGKFNIALTATLPNGVQCSKTKDFEITDLN